MLLDSGADVDKAMDNGVTPLFIASRNGHGDAVRMLLDSGADVNRLANNGHAPLEAACFHAHMPVVRLLLTSGATSNSNTAKSQHLLVIANHRGHTDLATWLFECAGWNRMQHAVEARREDLVRSMLRDDSLAATTSRAALLGAAGERGWTALDIASAGPESRLGALALPVSESLVGLVRRAGEPWSPLKHDLWPASFRGGVRTVLLVAHRLRGGEWREQARPESRMPTVVWLYALSFASWSWFPPA